jgi:hypothetical protein
MSKRYGSTGPRRRAFSVGCETPSVSVQMEVLLDKVKRNAQQRRTVARSVGAMRRNARDSVCEGAQLWRNAFSSDANFHDL